MRKHLWRAVAGFMAAVLLGGAVACSDNDRPQQTRKYGVGAKGGSFDFGDMTIEVPQGAVNQDTKLTATKPQRRKPADAPFGMANNAAFDISFEGGLQPADGKPLELRIPLRGDLLPKGYTPNQALFYHRLPDNKGFRLVPAVLDGGVLTAKLPHLSEWQVVYVNDSEIKTITGADQFSAPGTESCSSQAEGKSAGKVRISKRAGWSEKSGPILACLFAQDGEAHLRVTNRTNYMLSVVSTNGLGMESASGGVSEDMVRLLAKLGASHKVKDFLGRDGELTAKLTASNLPATVQLRAEPNTFLAEALWFGLSLFTAIVTGKKANEVVDQVAALIETAEVTDCLRTQMSAVNGKKPSFWDVFGLLTGKCGEIIIKALDNSKAWQWFWESHLLFVDLVKEGWNAFWSFVDGIALTFVGTVGVTVDSVAPACLSKSEFHAIMEQYFKGRRILLREPSIICQNGWAYNRTATFMEEYNQFSDGGHTFLRWNGNRWVVRHWGGSGSYFIGIDPICDEVPPRIKAKVCARPGG